MRVTITAALSVLAGAVIARSMPRVGASVRGNASAMLPGHACLCGFLLLALLPTAATAQDSGRLTPDLRTSLREAVLEASYAAREVGDGCAWRASNPAQEMQSTFTPSEGVLITGGDAGHPWRLRLTLQSWGRQGAVVPVETTEPVAIGRRVEYRRGPLTEWYVNDERGLEQGFTVETSTEGEGPLSLVLSIGGGLSAEVLPNGRKALFTDSEGTVVLHYTGLRAWDATGRDLEASLVVAGNELSVQVEDGGAVYPVYIDPWIAIAEAKLMAGDDEVTGDSFGISVSVWGDTAVVGAIYNDHPSGEGAAYVFIRSGTSWTEQAKLTASDAKTGDRFGCSVGLWGDTAVVGAYGKGAAYVFVRSGTIWTEQAKFKTHGDLVASDGFGVSVSISGDTAVVGAPVDDAVGGTDEGSAYVFVRSGTNWTQQAKLTASDAAAGDQFGNSTNISGDTALVGALYDDHAGGTNAGSAYVFVRSGTTWTEQAKLTANGAANFDHFGAAVGLSDDTALVGAPDNWWPYDGEGSAYVFVRSGTSWTQQAKLTASGAAAGDFFGASVSISGDTAVVGASTSDSWGADSGSACVFVRSGTSWSEVLGITPSDAEAYDYFGVSVCISGDRVLVGASGDDRVGGVDAGSAYVFRLCPPPTNYCTAGTSASGCQAALSAVGVASASVTFDFFLTASNVEGAKDGLFYFGTHGRQANPWGNGTSYQCVVPPLVRLPLMPGTGTVGLCDGSFALDINALWCPSCPKATKNPGPGAVVQAQLWYRDPLSTSNQTTSLSDAIEFGVGP